MALNFNSIKSILDEQEEEKKKKGAAAKPSSSSKKQSGKTAQSSKKTTSQTGRQQSTAKLHSDDVKLNYSVADELKKRRKTTQPASTKKQSGRTVASIDKKIDEEKASARKRAWSYGQSASGDLALKKSGQRVKELDEEKKTAVDYEPSVIDRHGLLGGLGYAAETSVAGAAGAVEDTFNLARALGDKGLSKAAGLVGLDSVSDFFQKDAEYALSHSLTDQYKESIRRRYNPNEEDEKAGQLTEAAGAMLPSIALNTVTSGGSGLLNTAAKSGNAGLALLGASAMGGGAQEGFEKTKDIDTALAYGALAGAVETATEKMFAGIPGLNVSGLDEVADKVIKKMVKDPTTSTLVKGAMDSLGEGFEEVVSTAVNPFLQRITVDPDASVSTKEELLEAGINGALLSALMQGGNLIAGKAVDATSRNTPKPATRSAEDMIREMLNMPRQTAREEVSGGERNLQGHTPEMQRTIQEYQDSTDPGLVAFAEIIRRLPDKNSANRMNYGLSPVSERAVYDIKNATGIDVSGYQNNIKGNAIEHIIKRHGETGQQDHSMQNVEDIGRIQYILDNYDSLEHLYNKNGEQARSYEFKNQDGSPSPKVLLKKRIDGTFYVVEAVPDTKAKKLQVVSAYIQPNKKGVTQVPDANAPGSTANTELANTPLQSGALQMYKPLDNVQDGRTDTVSKEAGQVLNMSESDPQLTSETSVTSAPFSTPSLPQGETGVNSSIVGPGQNNTSQTAVMSDAERQVREMLNMPRQTAREEVSGGERNLQGHTPEMQRTIQEYQSSVDGGIVEFVNHIRNLVQKKVADKLNYTVSEVHPKERRDILALTGIDVEGYKHNLNGGQINHIEAGHGSHGATDQSMSDINDLARLGFVLENYDTVDVALDEDGGYDRSWKFRNSDNTGALKVVYKKRIDGTYYIVEAVPDSKAKALQIVSAYIESAKSAEKKRDATINVTPPKDLQVSDAEAPDFTSEPIHATSFSTPSLPQGETGVNSSIVGPGQNNTSQTAVMSDAERQVREMLGLLPNPSENGLNGVNNAAYSQENTSNSAYEQTENDYVANNAYSQYAPGEATLQDVQAVAEELGISDLSESDLQRILGIYESARSDEPADQQFLEALEKSTGIRARVGNVTSSNGTEGRVQGEDSGEKQFSVREEGNNHIIVIDNPHVSTNLNDTEKEMLRLFRNLTGNNSILTEEDHSRINVNTRSVKEFLRSKYVQNLTDDLQNIVYLSGRQLDELIKYSSPAVSYPNTNPKHSRDAALGWENREIIFEGPDYSRKDKRWTRYTAELIIRKNAMGDYSHGIIGVKRKGPASYSMTTKNAATVKGAGPFIAPTIPQTDTGVNSSIFQGRPSYEPSEEIVNVGRNADGSVFYDITRIKRLPSLNGKQGSHLEPLTSASRESFSDDSVSQKESAVNSSISNLAQEDTAGKTLTAGEAMYDPVTDTITFAPGSSKAQVVRGVALHELTHALQRADGEGKRTKEYQALESFVLQQLGNDLQQQILTKQIQYLQHGLALTEQGAKDELVAEYVRNKLFEDPQAVRRLVNEQRSVAQRIYDWLVDTINRLRGTLGNSDLAELYRGRDLFQSALEGRVQGEGNGERQLYIGYDSANEPVVMIPGNIFAGKLDVQKAHEYIQAYAGLYINDIYPIVESGQKVRIGNDFPGEFTHSKYTQQLKKYRSLLNAKNQSLQNIGEMIEIATNRRWEPTKHSDNKDAKRGMYRYTTRFALPVKNSAGDIIDAKIYKADLLIRNASDGKKYLYDVINIKRDATSALTSSFDLARGGDEISSQNGTSSNAPNISQSDTGVNTSISQDQQTDTNKKQYALTDQQTQAILEALDARMRQRGMARNSIPKAVEAGVPGMEEVQQGLAAESLIYQPERMTETQQKGLDFIREKGLPEDAYHSLTGKMRRGSSLNATETAAAVELIKHFAQNGDRGRAVEMTEYLMETATEMGRAINALKLLQKYSPEGFLRFANSYLEHASKKQVPLTEQDKADLSALGQLVQDWPELARLAPSQRDSRIQETLREASAKLEEWVDTALHTKGVNMEDALTGRAMELIANKAPASWRQKFRALQRISMLSNPKTHVRNVVGNAVVTAGETLAHPISWLADTALSKMTGQRTHAAISGKEVLKGISDGINKANAQRRLGINLDGSQRYQEGSTYLQPKAFNPDLARNPLSKGAATFLNWADNLVSTALNYGDEGFFQGYYQDALGQMMRANHVTEPTAEMMEAATESALRRVFQDENAVTEAMQKLRNAVPYVGEIIAPFVKTPSNVIKMGAEYSPLGIAEGMMKAFVGENSIRRLQQQGVDTLALQRQCAELIGRGAVGTALMILGMALGHAGIGTGDEEEDQNRYQFNRTIGAIPNSFRIGDTYFDLSSLQSAGVPLLAGSAIGSAWRDQQQNTDAKWLDYFRGLLSGTVKAGNTATEMPMVQGISELLGGGYDQQGVGETLAKMALTGASQILPFGSLGRQVANAIDPYSRDRSSDKMLEQELINPVKAQIPGLADDFPIRYDTLGNPQQAYEGNSTAERLFNVFLNPLNTAKDKSTPVTDEIQRLFAESQDKSVFPARAPYDTNYEGTSYDFTTQQRQDWQAEQGQTLNQLLSSLFQSDSYRRASVSQQVEMISKAKDYAYAKAKDTFLEGQGISYEDNTVKKYQDAMDAGLSATEYLVGAAATSGSGDSDLQKVENILAIPGLSNAEKVRCAVFFTDNSRPSRYLKEALDRGLGDEYLEAYDACSEFDAKNDKGVSVTNLKKQRVFDYIQSLPWSAKDKLWFFTEVFGYKPY